MKINKFVTLFFGIALIGFMTTASAVPFNMLLESDENRSGGSEIFLADFASYSDLLDGTFSSSAFSQLNIGADFGVGGLVAIPQVVPDPVVPVPVPATVWVVGIGLISLIGIARIKKS